MQLRTRRRTLFTTGLVSALALAATACTVPPPSSGGGPGPGSGGGPPPTAGGPSPVIPGGGQWGALQDWGTLVSIHLAVSPNTGDVLMWDRIQGLTSAKRWNPSTGGFTDTPGLPLSLFCAFQARLPNGKLAVVGGTALNAGNTGLPVMQIFDWTTNSWTAGADMHTPRWYPTVIELPDGRLVSMGGILKAGQMANLSEVYNPNNNTWTELTGLAESKPMGLYPRAVLAPNGKIFVVKNASGMSAYMDVDTQKWIPITKAPPQVNGAGLAMYDTGKLLFYGSGTSRTDSWVIDLNAAAPAWRRVGSLHFARQKWSTVVLPDGRVMAIGGSTDGTSVIAKAVMTPEMWNPATEQWSDLPSQAVPRMYHSNALLLPDGRVLSAGGGRAGSAPNFPSGQIYNPAYLGMPNRPTINSVSSNTWQGNATVNMNIGSANGVSSVVLMGLPGVTHGMDTSQRRMTLQVTSAYNPANGNITVRVPPASSLGNSDYYVIALDSRGVPTAAKTVHVTGAAAAAISTVAEDASVPRVVTDLTPIDEND